MAKSTVIDPRLWLVQRLSLASSVLVAAIVVSGAAVRLTGSGLGCENWPACGKHQLTPALSFHPLIEFSNRLVTVLLVIVVGASLIAVLRLRTKRRDLVWLSAGLVFGVIGDAVLGGIVVYSKLNPYLVMTHLWWSLIIVIDAVVFWHRAHRDVTVSSRVAVSKGASKASWLLAAVLSLVVALGTATSGTGPHAGGFGTQQVAKRIPVELRTMAEYHALIAMLLVGLVVGIVLIVGSSEASPEFLLTSRRLLGLLVLQGGIGWLQYATHLPALVVELHVAGALMATIGTTRLILATKWRPLVQATRS